MLLLATRSGDKAREIRQILVTSFRSDIVSLDDAGIAADPAEDDIEKYDTFLANAHAKAEYFLRLSGHATLADDSGISVDALGGAPGVRSRRYAAAPGILGRALDEANNQRLLRELGDAPPDARTARYTCAAVLHLPDGRRFAALGVRTGRILEAGRGDGGFGYDPLFLDLASGMSFGELPAEVKNRTSHRARAFHALAANFPH